MNEISLGGRLIGPNHRPFIIAEMSGNHNQSLERAFELVDAAVASGADALKLQTYTAETMTLNINEGDFFINDESSLWKGRSLYDLYQEAYTPWEWHKPIFDRCKEKGILYLSTPFDESSVDFLEEHNVPFYKIASFENTDIPLIEKVAKTGKPIIISTGMATEEEMREAVEAARAAGCRDIVLLKCTSNYPADATDCNLMSIPDMRKKFGVQVGLSDHTMGIGVSVASVVFGATVIEKHFTLKRSDGGVDSSFSLEPQELKELREETEKAWNSIGKIHYGLTEKEKKSRGFRRTIYISEDIKAGEVLNSINLRRIRPGYGLPCKYFNEIIGKKVNCDLRKGTAMKFEYLE